MRTRAELIAWVEERIAWARRFAPHLVSLQGQAFMVHGTIGSVSYVTLDGVGVLEELDADGLAHLRSDLFAIRHVFFWGAKAHPELLRWLPERTAGQPDCQLCGGTGLRRAGDHPIGCTECGGFGWLVPVDITCDR